VRKEKKFEESLFWERNLKRGEAIFSLCG